jgi:hypothetical protein
VRARPDRRTPDRPVWTAARRGSRLRGHRARHTRVARVRRYREASRLLRVCPFGARLAGPFHAANPASIACTSLLSKTTFFAARLFGAGVMRAEKLNGPEIGRIPTWPVSGTILSGPRQLGASRAPLGGLHDMHGRSSSGSSTAGTRATRARQRMDKSGPRRPAGTARPHVVRGGSRYGAVDGARCISGNRSIPGYSINQFGFRVVCSSPPSRGSNHGRGRASRAYAQPGRAGRDGASPTPRPPASRGAFASRSCRNRGPSAWAPSPTRCRCGARRQCPPAPCDRRAAGGRPWGAAVVRGARAPPVPRARRRPDVWFIRPG